MWCELVTQSPGVRQRKAFHTHSHNKVFQNKRSYTSTYPHAFVLAPAQL